MSSVSLTRRARDLNRGAASLYAESFHDRPSPGITGSGHVSQQFDSRVAFLALAWGRGQRAPPPASNVEHGRLRGGMLSELSPSAGSLDGDRPHPPGRRGSRTYVGTDRLSAFAWRSLCQMPLCVVGVELGLLREQGAGGTVHLHRDLVERAGRRVMRKADPRNVL
jgi:hypothetical protein